MLILLLKDEMPKYKQIFQDFLNFQVFTLVVPIQGLGTETIIYFSVFHL